MPYVSAKENEANDIRFMNRLIAYLFGLVILINLTALVCLPDPNDLWRFFFIMYFVWVLVSNVKRIQREEAQGRCF
jgi:hypothetical protein